MFFKKTEYWKEYFWKFGKKRRTKKFFASAKNQETNLKQKIERNFELALKQAKKNHSIPTAQLHYLEAKILYPTLLPKLKNIFSEYLKKINHQTELKYYLENLFLADDLKKMVLKKQESLEENNYK